MIPFQTACVENIYTNKEDKLVKENVLVNIYAHVLWEIANFKAFDSLWAELDRDLQIRRPTRQLAENDSFFVC